MNLQSCWLVSLWSFLGLKSSMLPLHRSIFTQKKIQYYSLYTVTGYRLRGSHGSQGSWSRDLNISILTSFTWCRHGITRLFSNQLNYSLNQPWYLSINPTLTKHMAEPSILFPSFPATPSQFWLLVRTFQRPFRPNSAQVKIFHFVTPLNLA